MSRSLLSSALVNGRTFIRHNTRGPQCAPPMRFISPTGHVIRYLFYMAVFLSYPTYVLCSLNRWRPRNHIMGNSFPPELQAVLDDRAERRRRGETIPILDPEWIKWINERDREKRARESADQQQSSQ